MKLLILILTGLLLANCSSKTKNYSPLDDALSGQSNVVTNNYSDKNLDLNIEALATKDQVEKAYCKSNYAKTQKEIKDYFSTLPESSLGPVVEQVTISGVVFKNENQSLLTAFEYLVQKNEVEKQKVSSNVFYNTTDFQQKFNINPHCDKVFCATQKIFGNNVGPKMLYLMHKLSINTSPYAWSHADLFTDKELNIILQSLEVVPAELMPNEPNQKLIKFTRGLRYANQDINTITNGQIEVFDLFNSLDSTEQKVILFQQFADNFSKIPQPNPYYSAQKLTDNVNQNNFDLGPTSYKKESAVISPSSKVKTTHSLAEQIVAYRLNPLELKSNSPEHYSYIQYALFGGKEFLNKKTCTQKRFAQINIEKLDTTTPLFDQKEKDQLFKLTEACFNYALLQNSTPAMFKSCFNNEATHFWLQLKRNEFKKVSTQYYDPVLKLSRIDFSDLRAEFKTKYSEQASLQLAESLQEAGLATDAQNKPLICDGWSQKISQKTNWKYPSLNSLSAQKNMAIYPFKNCITLLRHADKQELKPTISSFVNERLKTF